MERLVKEKVFADLKDLFLSCEGNVVDDVVALEGCRGLRIFDEPIFGVSAADDELYTEFKKPDVIGEFYMTPREWLPGARSVISFFLPFSERLRKANTKDPVHTANEWLHGRKEGQACIRRCPVHAITLEHGKNQLICQSRVNSPNEFHPGRYGCGKCEVGIPCETKIPRRL